MASEIMRCDLHDYIEIACLFHIKVELFLKDESQIKGIPITTKIIEKIEYLECDSHKKIILVSLLNIVRMRACEINPHFETVNFK